MNNKHKKVIEQAREAAIKVLKNNFPDHEEGLPRTAAWGYPEPYTRDLLISSLGILASGEDNLISSIRLVLETLAENQSSHGQIPGLVDVPEDLGSSDTTPLFLLVLEIFRKHIGNGDFLETNARQATTWLDYQSPFDNGLITQLPTSDWRDEQWIFGYGLYVNSLVHLYLKLKGGEKTEEIKKFINHRLSLKGKPYYAVYAYKIYTGQRFDLLGNSLAIIAGISTLDRGREIIEWMDKQCDQLNRDGELSGSLPPVLIPYIVPEDEDWRLRYEEFNMPGEYHNGGIWPFTVGFYIVALLKLDLIDQAQRQLFSLAQLVMKSRRGKLKYGFNEWYSAQTGEPRGQDWQTWSAAGFLYAAECLARRKVLYLERGE